MSAPRVLIGDLSELQHAFATEFQTQAAAAIARRGRFVVALTGGSAAPALFPALAALPIDWTRVEIFWIDERAVPPTHSDSNYALASRLLLTPARVPAERVHRLQGELPDLDQAARRASDELKSIAGDPPQLDLAILGVGEDGHVASIFPGLSRRSGDPPAELSAEARSAKAEARSAKADPVIPIYDAPKPPSRRLTLALSVLASARLVMIAAFGVSKAAVMRAALDERGATTPVAELLRRAPSSLVLLDREAGLS